MEINNLQAAAAYAGSTAPQPANTQVENQNTQAARTDLDEQAAATAQRAVEVTLSQEAQDLQTDEAPNEPAAPLPAPENETPEPVETNAPVSQIINIVA